MTLGTLQPASEAVHCGEGSPYFKLAGWLNLGSVPMAVLR
jgi:hypothetical protein